MSNTFDDIDDVLDSIDFDRIEASVTESSTAKESKERTEIDKLKEGGNDCAGGACTI